jgi:hypothetical protein
MSAGSGTIDLLFQANCGRPSDGKGSGVSTFSHWGHHKLEALKTKVSFAPGRALPHAGFGPPSVPVHEVPLGEDFESGLVDRAPRELVIHEIAESIAVGEPGSIIEPGTQRPLRVRTLPVADGNRRIDQPRAHQIAAIGKGRIREAALFRLNVQQP